MRGQAKRLPLSQRETMLNLLILMADFIGMIVMTCRRRTGRIPTSVSGNPSRLVLPLDAEGSGERMLCQ